MLLEFRVSNFRSFRDEAALSLVASTDKDHPDNLLETGLPGIPSALRSIGVYGANASGKSNLVRGLQFMRAVILESALLQPGAQYRVQPFRLDPATEGAPTTFEATFLKDGVRYQYGFDLRPDRIVGEWLIVYKTKQPQVWFRRSFDEATGKDSYKFGTHLHGARHIWREATRPNSLYLSTAVQLNSDLLKPLFDWFSRDLVVIGASEAILPILTVNHIRQTDATSVVRFLETADIGIADIKVVPKKGFQQSIHVDLATGRMNPSHSETEVLVPEFRHSSGERSAVFALEDESDGTQKLFALAGPLFEILANGRVLVVDELDRSLHALLVRKLVEMFHGASNPKGAQLIFTTHDTTLLSADLLRRDQIWFTEKGADQASRLFPLTDFSPRKGQAIEKGYLEGRFGAVPILGELKA